jgi:hypothetical protein
MTGIFSLHRNLQNDNCDRRENFKIHYLWLDVFSLPQSFSRQLLLTTTHATVIVLKARFWKKLLLIVEYSLILN